MTAANANSKVSAVQPAEEHDAAQADIDMLVHRFFGQASAGPGSPAIQGEASPAGPPRDFDGACALLDRAARAFESLVKRCRELEADLAEAGGRARSQAAAHEEATDQWKRLAAGLRAQAMASNRLMTSLKARCEAAEARAAVAEDRASALEEDAAQAAGGAASARQLSAKLHDKVVSAFGVGSRLHPMLDAAVPRSAAD